MDELIYADKQLTLFINSFYSDFWDVVVYLFTSKLIWVPLYVSLMWMIFKRQGGRGLVTVGFIVVAVVLADQLTSGLMKPLIGRLRPSHDDLLQYMVHTVNDYRGGLFGFASSHAANTFVVAAFVAYVVRHGLLSFSLYSWALLNCYGRIYQGVHFAGDILAGALIGIVIARILYEVYLHVVLHFFVITHHNKRTLINGLSQSFGRNEPLVVSYTFWVTIGIVFIAVGALAKYHGASI